MRKIKKNHKFNSAITSSTNRIDQYLLGEVIEKTIREDDSVMKDLLSRMEIDYEKLDDHHKRVYQVLCRDIICQMDITDCRLSAKENAEFWKMDKSVPSDYIVFKSFKDAKYIATYWKRDKSVLVPADLVFSGTIPLKDMILEVKMDKSLGENYSDLVDDSSLNKMDKDEVSCLFRIFIFPQYKQIVEYVMKDDKITAPIGGVVIHYEPFYKKGKEVQIAFPIFVHKGNDEMMIRCIAWYNGKRDQISHANSSIMMERSISGILSIWYGIQLSLLNPITEKVIVKSKEDKPISERKVKVKENKINKTMYVKKYYIIPEDIEHTIIEHRKNNMSCPLWYVIGHWRQYKNGKRIWVKGFWKGVDRAKMDGVKEEDAKVIRKRLLDMRAVDKIMKQKTE